MKGPSLSALFAASLDPLGLIVPAAEPVCESGVHATAEFRRGRASSVDSDGTVAGTLGAAPTPAQQPAALPIELGQATDAASPEQAYQLWKGRVWRFSSRLGVPSEALEDATQDVFTAVFRRWDDFRGLSSRRTWVLGFVPRVASAYRRRYRTRAERAERGDLGLLELGAEGGASAGALREANDHDPFESTARREATRIIGAFLAALPELDRQLFVLVDLEDTSVVEAAAILELGTRRAYKSLEKTRRALEATLVRHRAVDTRRLR